VVSSKYVRKFIPFDQDAIFKEMDDLPEDDFIALKHAMGKYAQSDSGAILPPAMVEDQHKYGAKYKPIFKVRHRNGDHQGRAFFYFGAKLNDTEPLFVLLVYKKEKDEAPRHLVEAAYQRMLKHKERLNGLA
jgi:hypothetical protein